jgi:hypothetical protein
VTALAVVVGRVALALALFSALFLSLFWTPGVLLSLFALVLAADARAFSQAVDRTRRGEQLVASMRRYRGGWIDSPTTTR